MFFAAPGDDRGNPGLPDLPAVTVVVVAAVDADHHVRAPPQPAASHVGTR